MAKLYYIEFKTFVHSKDTVNRVKRQPTKLEKIFASYISDRRLIHKYIKNSYNSAT